MKDIESGQVVAKQNRGASRYHVDHWRERIYHKTFNRDGVRHELPEWSVRLQHLGRREAFSLGTANATLATAKAKEIAVHLEANGWDSTIAMFKPSPMARADACTVGDFLEEVGKRSHLNPMTLRRYAVKLRKIVADVAKVESGLRGKARRLKYDYTNGGRKAWLARVDGQPLSVLTADTVNAWRNHYVAKAGTDPVRRKSAERSVASYIRCSRALFSEDILPLLQIKLPENPFKGVKVKDPGPQRYHSDVSAEFILTCAERELRGQHPQCYLALFLCLWAGLRRKEADLLLWKQIDFAGGQIHVRRTEYFSPKTDESERQIDLAPAAVDLLRGYKKGCESEFVLNGGEPNPKATYDYYRCDCTWRFLHDWLRGKGVRQKKAIHTLRKESGSLIASEFGIEAARQHLGHRDIRVTSAHYLEKKKRVEIALPIAGAPKEAAS